MQDRTITIFDTTMRDGEQSPGIALRPEQKAFLASALVVKPFLNYVRRSGFAPFAWYRIVAGAALFAAVAAGWL